MTPGSECSPSQPPLPCRGLRVQVAIEKQRDGYYTEPASRPHISKLVSQSTALFPDPSCTGCKIPALHSSLFSFPHSDHMEALTCSKTQTVPHRPGDSSQKENSCVTEKQLSHLHKQYLGLALLGDLHWQRDQLSLSQPGCKLAWLPPTG